VREGPGRVTRNVSAGSGADTPGGVGGGVVTMRGWSIAAAAGTVAASAYYATCAVRSQWLGATICRGRKDRPAVALTFDDGPSEDTERVLDVLAEHDAKGAFFMIGRHVERYPAIARRIVSEGHAIGNHSYSHPIYLYRSRASTDAELRRAQQVIADVTGIQPRWARPPGGVRTPAYFAAARELDLPTVQWSASGCDWRLRTASSIVRSVMDDVGSGAIVLLHDGDAANRSDRRATAEAVAPLIAALDARGLAPAPLEQVIGA
jgi:peptidoglycan/xylan/chitin deacetylase (PgdA/CDA1 family)